MIAAACFCLLTLSPATLRRHLFGALLSVNGRLLTHGSLDSDDGLLLLLLEELGDLVTDIAIGHADIVLLAIIVVQVKETIIRDIDEHVLSALDNGDVHVVGGRAEILELLASEDINGDEMDLGVTVLAGLGGRHVDDLAGAALDHDEAVLAQSRALHGVGGRGTGVGALEGGLMIVRHFGWLKRILFRFKGEDDIET